MVWLDGKPTLSKILAFPVDDPDVEREARTREAWSVMDDQILFWKAFPLFIPVTESPRTIIYMANTTIARQTQADRITLERVLELDYAPHRLEIVPDVGFVTAEWQSNSGVHFRAHSWTGELLRERHCPAQAGYGDLSVLGPMVSLCVASIDPVRPLWKDVFSSIYDRMDFQDYQGGRCDFPLDLRADSIATWNADSGDLCMVKIPQVPLREIQHSADLQYISPRKIVLAGSSADGDGAVLCAFSVDAEDGEDYLQFYQGEHTDLHMINNSLGRRSTSTSGPIVVHDHDWEGRITIFNTELLSGDIPSFATSEDPPGMREVYNCRDGARTLSLYLSGSPSVAGTRVLVRSAGDAGPTKIFILDFDQTLLASLLSKQPSERADWNEELVNRHAQVKVVTRRFCYAVCYAAGGHSQIFDQEYPWPQRAPAEWEAYLDTVFKNNEDEEVMDVEALPLGVKYDEAPEEHRDPVPFGYVQTILRLEGVTDPQRLAITPYSILELPKTLPKLTENGRVFYFD